MPPNKAASKVEAVGPGSVAIGGRVERTTIRTGPLYQFPWRRYALPLAIIVFILMATATVVIVQQIRTLTDVPAHMTGDGARVAIAPLDAGAASPAPRASDLAQQVQSLVQDQSKSAGDTLTETWSPVQTGPVGGESAAAERARRIEADAIVYGTVLSGEDVTTVQPKFYLAPRSLPVDDAALAREYDLGEPIPSRGNYATNPTTFQELQGKLGARVSDGLQVVKGLDEYRRGAFADANASLQAAVSQPTWQGDRGKEIAYLFLGYTEMKLGHGAAAARRWLELAIKVGQPATRDRAQRAVS